MAAHLRSPLRCFGGPPLFTAWRDSGGRAIPYPAAHNRAWTNVVLWSASWVFVGIIWLLALLLGQLFSLIRINFLLDLLNDRWFAMMLTGGASGAVIGLLRDREAIIGTLRCVVTTVFAALAPVLAVGLALFLVALPVTGLSPLWGATRSTTPVLLACVIGALVLSNAILGDSDADERRSALLRTAAMVLDIAILPLAVIAAVSTGLRIRQYGLSPDRLWAVVFTAIACAYGLAYLVALARGRTGWAHHVRAANLRLAIGLCAIAFLLSTPVLSFGAISTRDQLARLADGRTKPEKFDWRALRWDFGPAGKAAVGQLAKTGATPAIRTAAAKVSTSENRYDIDPAPKVPLDARMTILPVTVLLPPTLRARIERDGPCSDVPRCVLFYKTGGSDAVVTNGNWAKVFGVHAKGEWTDDIDRIDKTISPEDFAKGPVTIGTVRRRQVFVGGKPAGAVFE